MPHYSLHPEYQALFAAIKARPDDDLPRLVAADWLEEHGWIQRAEFIRVSCEWAKLDDDCFGGWACEACGARPELNIPSRLSCDERKDYGGVEHRESCHLDLSGLATKEVYILDHHYTVLQRARKLSIFDDDTLPEDWRILARTAAPTCLTDDDHIRGPYCVFHRGFVEEVHAAISYLVGAICHFCDGVGFHDRVGSTGDPERPFDPDTDFNPDAEFYATNYVDMCGVCGCCSGVGRVSSVLPLLLELHPVTRVVVYDMDAENGLPIPAGFTPNESLPYHWRFADDGGPHTLPRLLHPSCESVRFCTHEEATNWLSNRLIDHFSP